jgi:hypothetical protein
MAGHGKILELVGGPLFPALAGFLVILLFLFSHLHFETIPDTSWLLTILDRISAGDRLYTDIVETNPPFSIWLYMPPYFAAKLLGIAPETATQIYTVAICAVGVGSTHWLMRSMALADRRRLRVFSLSLLVFAVVLAGNAFTERDQIGTVMALPLFVLAIWRSDLTVRPRPELRHWLVAGLLGGVLPLAKPYYAIVYIVAGLWVAIKRRDIRMFFLPEYLIPAAILLIYMAMAYLIYPQYFQEILPLLEETYLAFRHPFLSLLFVASPFLFLMLGKFSMPSTGLIRQLSNLLFTVSLAAWIPYFYQGKGWPYHQYPAILLASVAILMPMVLDSGRPENGEGSQSPRRMTILALVALLLAHVHLIPIERPPEIFVREIRQETQNPTVAMIGGDISASFPLTRLIGGRWIEPYCSDWLVVYAIRMKWQAQAAGDVAKVDYYADMARRYAMEKLARLEKNPPKLILLDHGVDFNNEAAYLMKRPGYVSFMQKYRKIADSDIMAAYLYAGDS